jgi:uncharacterized protein with HEPN domain
MKRRSDLARLQDARRFAQDAVGHAIGLSPETLAEALQPQHAALYALTVVGEALAQIPVDLRNEASGIAWKSIIGLRNHLIHAYWQIDLEIIADVIKNRIDPLVAELDKLITFVERIEK